MSRKNHNNLPDQVKSVDMVAHTPELRVSVHTLSSGQQVQWHYHTLVTDTFFCLSGTVSLQYGSQGEVVTLDPGESYQIPARTPHKVTGAEEEPCRFLLVQGIGVYDFVPVKD